MPFMYPEELAKLRADHPGLQYDGHGRVIGVTQPDSVQMAAEAIYQMPGVQPDAWSFGPTRADFQNSKDFVGPLQPQWWDPNGELMQLGQQGQQDWLGGFMAGRDLQPRRAARPGNPSVPAAGKAPAYDYSKYGTTFPLEYDDGSGEGPARPPYEDYGTAFPLDADDGSGEGPARRTLRAAVEGLGTDFMRQPGDMNPLDYWSSRRRPRPYGSNADELWPLIQKNPGYLPQYS